MAAELGGFVQSLKNLSAAQLMEKKDAIERDIKEFSDVLETQGGVGMSGPLVDEEGFPRSDIDVYAVRTARNRIICLQNDHKAVMLAIEAKLHLIHAEARSKSSTATQGDTSSATPPQGGGAERPERGGLARVSSVAPGSPADSAGVKTGDVILEFGSVKQQTFKGLKDIGTVVQHSRGKAVRVLVRRDQTRHVLSLTPRPWSGRGLLGCNIVPLE